MRKKSERCWRGHLLEKDGIYKRKNGQVECKACSLIRSKSKTRYPGGMKSLLYEAVDALRPIAKMLEAMKTEDNEVNFINTLKFWHVTKASEIVKKFDSAVEKTK